MSREDAELPYPWPYHPETEGQIRSQKGTSEARLTAKIAPRAHGAPTP